jgi:hypothetical protein
MTLTCRWASDRTGTLVMAWTTDDIPAMVTTTRRGTRLQRRKTP